MNKKLLLCTLLLGLSSPSWAEKTASESKTEATPQCPLAGTWKSNKEKTMPAINKNMNIRLEQKARMAQLFGKVTVTYSDDCTSAEANVDGRIEKLAFEVVKQDKTSITVKDGRTRQPHTMRFEGDCYLMAIQGVEADEYYCKVK